jgi:hypothetical protein
MNILTNLGTAIAEMIDPLKPAPTDPIDVKPMLIIATPSRKHCGGYELKSDPESITFHNRAEGVPRALQCTLVEVDQAGVIVPTSLRFTGYSYVSNENMAMLVTGLRSDVVTIAFNFDGRPMRGELTFFVSNGLQHSLQMDPQVGNDPTTGGNN